MVGVYFSGTGNTKYCIEKFLEYYNGDSKAYSIEAPEVLNVIKENKKIVIAYPIYYSNLPKIVREFITKNREVFQGKEIFIIATMGLFSGDGTGCSARLVQKFGAKIIGGLHIKMPDCIADVKALKKPLEQNKQLIKQADLKIKDAVRQLKNDRPTKDGLGIHAHVVGLFGQRLWFYGKTKHYTDKLKIDPTKCIGCQQCVKVCPLGNLAIENNKIVAKSQCTMCYRCISLCKKQAITLIGKKIIEQSRLEKYLE